MNAGTAPEIKSEAGALAILGRACEAAGLNADGARLLRLGSNAVYRLTAPVVARIAYADTDVKAARRTVEVARWLESVDYPAARALELDQPVVIDGYPVTLWEALSDDGDEYATIDQVAEVIARLHKLAAPESLVLPSLEPFGNAEDRIAGSRWLTEDDRAWMKDELARLRAEYSRLDFALPQGPIHGDANIGNVLRDYHGNPVVIDLDGFATGPREWDLIQTAIYYDRFGWHTREQYETFARVYGFDIMQWPGYPALADIREFIIVTWIVGKAGEDERTSAEARKRLRAIRAGSSRKDWLPFLVIYIFRFFFHPKSAIHAATTPRAQAPLRIMRVARNRRGWGPPALISS
jgi:aminoglycoside phosphotransferase (APT) family kinase protein